MKRTLFVALVVLACPSVTEADNWNAIERLPNQTAVSILVRDNARAYFHLTPEASLTVPIEGPCRLRVVTRAAIPADAKIVTYQVRATENGRPLETLDTETSAADQVRLAGEVTAVGKSRRMVVDIPAGAQHVVLTL